ncbi:MAG TPA: acyl-CoA thioesterase [Alphaproteobacteria bacterium]|nr:acyl-CoA thioesterase [Alphaproteobacteria bacterium]
MKRSVLKRMINFADCDPAQIVFYPRYFEWFDRGTEMMFRSVGLAWEKLFAKGEWSGVPLLDVGANFKRPCRFGDSIEIESWVDEWRGKTFLVRHHVKKDGELAVEGHELRAWTVKDKSRPAGMRAAEVPGEVVALFQA